jgi:hypothetical protein
MKIKTIFFMLVSFCIIGMTVSVSGLIPNESTNLQITEINGGIGGVTAVISNTGDVTAENFAISLFVEGGILGNIDISQVCSGCGDCGTTIPVGESKTESTREAGFIMGFGPIDIMVTASADNADLVSASTNGFVIGPIIIL